MNYRLSKSNKSKMKHAVLRVCMQKKKLCARYSTLAPKKFFKSTVYRFNGKQKKKQFLPVSVN